MIKKIILGIICLIFIQSLAVSQVFSADDNSKEKLGVVIYTKNPETVWNAFRLANLALEQNDAVSVFLLGEGVEAQNIESDVFDVHNQMTYFADSGGKIFSCGTCLELRNEGGTELCPISSMYDLYDIIKQSDKVISF